MDYKNKDDKGCVGELRSNFTATEFDIYGIGESCDKNVPLKNVRNQYGSVIYDMGESKENKLNMNVIIPKLDNNKFIEYKPRTVYYSHNIIERRTYDL